MARQRPQLSPSGGATGVEHADWAETYLIAGDLSRLSRSELREQFRGVAEDDPDFQIDLMLSEVQRRQSIAPDRYPFTRDGTGVGRLTGARNDVYDFLVLASFSPQYRKTKERLDAADLLFDNIVRDATRHYLGEGAEAVRFASPPSGDRPSSFPDAVTWLGDRLGVKKGPGLPRPLSKDGGLDIAAWRKFRDKRSGFAVLMLQATLQPQREWSSKAKDVVQGRWVGWLDLGMPPVTGLAVPYVISQTYGAWDELRRTVVLVLDRLRIVELLPAGYAADASLTTWLVQEKALLL